MASPDGVPTVHCEPRRAGQPLGARECVRCTGRVGDGWGAPGASRRVESLIGGTRGMISCKALTRSAPALGTSPSPTLPHTYSTEAGYATLTLRLNSLVKPTPAERIWCLARSFAFAPSSCLPFLCERCPHDGVVGEIDGHLVVAGGVAGGRRRRRKVVRGCAAAQRWCCECHRPQRLLLLRRPWQRRQR